MGTQYDRYLSVSLGGQTITELAGNPDVALRVRFKIETVISQACNTCQIIITNLSTQTSQTYTTMASQRAQLQVTAGYLDNNGLIFQGDTFWAANGRESPTDKTLQLFARDGGNAYDYGVVSKSLQKGSTPQDHYNTLLQALQPFGITQGYVPQQNLSSPSYPRGVAFAGMVKDYMRTLAASTNCTWSIQNGALQMVPNDGAVPGGPTVLNSSTGLIGIPTQTFGGIMIRCLINPAINLGSGNLVQVDQSLISQAGFDATFQNEAQMSLLPSIATDGIYRVCSITTTGDTRGNDWYMDLACVANGSANVPANLAFTAGN